jgi:hypothetical protein
MPAKLSPKDYQRMLRDERRAAGLCIYDGRDLGRPPHGPPTKGGRCDECYAKLLDSIKRHKTPGAVDRRTRAARRGLV